MGPPDAPIYSAIGDMVNTAARLENMTKAYSCVLVVSEVALREAGIEAHDAQPHHVRVRGRNERLAVYAVADPRTLIQGQTTVS
jgi:adenylate cyclase